MASRWMSLLLVAALLAEAQGGPSAPGDGSGKHKGTWRWKGDRSRE